jgi:hypothetical protein
MLASVALPDLDRLPPQVPLSSKRSKAYRIEVRYAAKTGKSKAKVKRAVKKAGPSRKRVERRLGK